MRTPSVFRGSRAHATMNHARLPITGLSLTVRDRCERTDHRRTSDFSGRSGCLSAGGVAAPAAVVAIMVANGGGEGRSMPYVTCTGSTCQWISYPGFACLL